MIPKKTILKPHHLTWYIQILKKKLDTAYKNYIKNKEIINAITKVNINLSDKNLLDNSNKTIEKINNDYINSRNSYYLSKYKFDNEEFKAILKSYGELIGGKKKNEYLYFIADLFSKKYDILQDKQIDIYSEKNGYSSVQKSIPFLGGDMAFETIIDGLSRFLAKRIKEELTIHAIGKIKTYLEHPTPENYCYELLAVMPTTTNYLKQFDADQLLNFTDELKQYIEQDLNNLLENAANLKETPRLKGYISKYPDLEFAFEGLAIIPQLSKIKSPIDYFELLENSRSLTNWRNETDFNNSVNITKYNIAQSLRLASMLAYSMTIVENGDPKFASVDFISNYGNEPNFYFLYFGLLHQQNTKYFNVNFVKSDKSTVNFDLHAMMGAIPTDKVTNATDNFKFLKSNLVAIAQNAEKVYSQGLAIKKKNKNNEEVKYDEIYSFINDFIGFSEEVVTSSDFLLDIKYKIMSSDIKNEIDLKNKLAPYFSVAKIANNVVMDLHQKKYANAIVRAIEIPLSFKINNTTTIKILNTLKNNISNQKDLLVINKLYNPNLSTLTDAEKVNYLTKLNSDLTILKLKISEKSELKPLYDLLNGFNISSSLTTANVNSEISKLLGIKAELKNKYKELLANFGYKEEETLKKLDTLLDDNKLNETVKNAIKQKISDYSKAVFGTMLLNENLDPNFIENELKDLLTSFVPQLLQSNTKITDNKAIKLIHFFNDISASKDGKDVEKAIDAFALPVGSSSLKEKASTYVSLNAFPGILLGNEHSDFEAKKDAFTLGFTAPVGFYVQLKSYTKGATLGLFIPIIDIAAPVRLRLDDTNDTKTLPDFNFNDIFSPGLYFSYGFKNSPFVLNLGGQYGPKLRDIPDGNNGFTSVDSYRINIGVSIDIPLLTLSSKYKD